MTTAARPHVSSAERRHHQVPGQAEVRARVREIAAEVAATLPADAPPGREALERAGLEVAERAGLCQCMSAFCTVAVGTAFWAAHFAAVPYHRRLLLLPHCLRKRDSCTASYQAGVLQCGGCGGCAAEKLVQGARSLGYHVMMAEGMPDLVKVLLTEPIDAMLGVACLDSLEESFGRVQQFGLPFAAIPLLRDGCCDTELEFEVVEEIMNSRSATEAATLPGLSRLLRTACGLFEGRQLRQILQSSGAALGSSAPAGVLDQTEAIALEWLSRAGKRFRPFITLAAYEAVMKDRQTGEAAGDVPGVAADEVAIPESVKAVAVAMEAFHKASLAHDDVEDDDRLRYGQPTLYASYGAATAINAGDYLIGLGYRLVAGQAAALGAETAGAIIACLSESHLNLCQGQGAELLLTGDKAAEAAAGDVLKLYALKTAPAFTAAMLAGMLLAGESGDDAAAVRRFCRHMGVGYQVLDDLDDWQGNRAGADGPGDDFLGGRPTILLTFAVEAGHGQRLGELLEKRAELPATDVVKEVTAIYEQAGVFDKALRVVDKCRARAAEAMGEVKSLRLRQLMSRVLEMVMRAPS